jgi:hypothetical protein
LLEHKEVIHRHYDVDSVINISNQLMALIHQQEEVRIDVDSQFFASGLNFAETLWSSHNLTDSITRNVFDYTIQLHALIDTQQVRIFTALA